MIKKWQKVSIWSLFYKKFRLRQPHSNSLLIRFKKDAKNRQQKQTSKHLQQYLKRRLMKVLMKLWKIVISLSQINKIVTMRKVSQKNLRMLKWLKNFMTQISNLRKNLNKVKMMQKCLIYLQVIKSLKNFHNRPRNLLVINMKTLTPHFQLKSFWKKIIMRILRFFSITISVFLIKILHSMKFVKNQFSAQK